MPITIYKTDNDDDIAYIPIPFTVNINNDNKNKILATLKSKANNLGVNIEGDIVDPFTFNLNTGDSASLIFRGMGDKQTTTTGLTVGHWVSQYNYIEAMQYDYGNAEALELIIDDSNFDINVKEYEVQHIYEPVIVEFEEDPAYTYTPVWLEKS